MPVPEVETLWVGVDIGGTRIKSVLLDAAGNLLTDRTTPTSADLSTHLRVCVEQVLSDTLADAGIGPDQRPSGVGVVVPGVVDDARGMALLSANLGWRDLDLVGALEGLAPVVAVGHDVRAGLLAEHHWGAAAGVGDVLFVAIGTGLAGATMTGGTLLAPTGWTGGIGHVRVAGASGICGCGRTGCLETIAAARGITRRWHAAGGTGDVATLVAAAKAGDERAASIWTDAVEGLAEVLAPVFAATGIPLLLLGGGVSRAGTALLDPLRAALADRLLPPLVPQLRTAGLGERAGALGAARKAMDAAQVGGDVLTMVSGRTP